MKVWFCGALGAAVMVLVAECAFAHAILEKTTAAQGSSYRGVIDVMHGCAGSPTIAVKVTIPDGVTGARPLAKAGWTITTETETDGAAARVRSITWTGGRVPNDEFDEFVFLTRLPADLAPGGSLYFPVLQTCEKGESAWTQIPAPTQESSALKWPAPALHIVAASDAAAPAEAAAAPPVIVGSLTIGQPWLRATLPGAKVAAGYLRITNLGTAADRLVFATLPGAGRGDVHEMTRDGDVMRMRPLAEGVEIKPGQTIELKPGGLHLMFEGVNTPLLQGETVHGTVTFAHAGQVALTFQVAGVGAGSPGGDAMQMHHH